MGIRSSSKIVLTLILIVTPLLSFAAIEVDEHIETFAPQGQTNAIQTDFTETGKERFEKYVPNQGSMFKEAVEITREDLHRKWTVCPEDKRYVESQLTGSASSASVTVAGLNRSTAPANLPDFLSLQTSFPACEIKLSTDVVSQPPETLAQTPVTPYLIHITLACIPKGSTKELWSYRVREKIWMSDASDAHGLPSQSQGRFYMTAMAGCIIPPEAFGKSQGFETMLNMLQASLKTTVQLNFLLAQIQASLHGTPIRRAIVWLPISEAKTISFKDQESELAKSRKGALFGSMILPPPTNTAAVLADLSYVAVAAVVGAARSSYEQHHTTHQTIPPWVLDVDPDFALHGVGAELREVANVKSVPSEGLFDLPSGYKKIEDSDVQNENIQQLQMKLQQIAYSGHVGTVFRWDVDRHSVRMSIGA